MIQNQYAIDKAGVLTEEIDILRKDFHKITYSVESENKLRMVIAIKEAGLKACMNVIRRNAAIQRGGKDE